MHLHGKVRKWDSLAFAPLSSYELQALKGMESFFNFIIMV